MIVFACDCQGQILQICPNTLTPFSRAQYIAGGHVGGKQQRRVELEKMGVRTN